MHVQPLRTDLGERRETNPMVSQNAIKPEHIIAQPHIKATAHEAAQLSACVSLQKDHSADTLKGDNIFIPCADSAHYTTGPLFLSGHTWPGGEKHLIFHLGSYLALFQLIK